MLKSPIARSSAANALRKSMLVAIACSIALSQAGAAEPTQIDVPAGELVAALKAFSSQADVELVYSAEQLRNLRTQGVQGVYSPEQALALLLKNTEFKVHTDASGAMVIVPAQTTPAVDAEQSSRLSVEEIIVTAQKRTERLQDVPVPVAALDAGSLFERNQLRLQDYYMRVPGMNLVTGVRGEAQISIRGLSTGTGTNPTVGVTVDDVPYGSSVLWGNGAATPDIDPSDLARLEVLRGPQGTLYGANSIGGLLKFVTVDPSTERMSGRIEAGLSSIDRSDKDGYSVRGAVNLPITDTLAMRASGFSRRSPGYIDNPITGVEDVNQLDVGGGRVSVLWQPSESTSLKVSGLMQDSRRDGSPTTNLAPGLGDLEQNAIRDTGRFNRQFEAYSAIFNAALGSLDLVSVSGYNINRTDGLVQAGAIPTYETTRTRKLTQEVRLSGPLGSQFEWLLGGFYTDEESEGTQEQVALGADGAPLPPTRQPAGNLLFVEFPTTFQELAMFANLTWQVSERFDIQFGGRVGRNEQEYERVATGPRTTIVYGLPSPAVVPRREAEDNSFTYLVTPRFKATPDLMVYARVASGYRPGSNNTGVPSVPTTYRDDSTLNYELGMKGQMLGGTLSFDASLYHIDWEDIQITVVPVGTATSYVANVGSARSQGAELSVQMRPLTGLSVTSWVAYNRARLIEDFPSNVTAAGGAGQRLPFSAPWSGNLTIDQQIPIGAELTGFLGASLSYVGERRGSFVAGAARRQTFPSYERIDLHAGVDIRSWRIGLYANNVADERGAITGDPSVFPSGIVYIQPRTIGMSVARTF